MFQLISSMDRRLTGLGTSLSGASEPPKLCGFLSLPQELRDMIYSELIISGHVAILRVSQQVHDEAKDCLHKRGICRLEFNHCGEDLDFLDPPKSSLSNVQNFDIKIYINCDENYVGSLEYRRRAVQRSTPIAPGSQPYVQGAGSCTVTLVLGSVKHPHLPRSVLHFIKRARTFKLVTLRIHTAFSYHPFDRRTRDVVKPEHENMLTQASASLRGHLGDPEWKSEPDHGFRWNLLVRPLTNPFPAAPYLEFHPNEAGMALLPRPSTVSPGCLCESRLATV